MISAPVPVQVVELSMDELRSIIARSNEGLSKKDRESLSLLLESYASLLGEIGDKQATIARLRQLGRLAELWPGQRKRKFAGVRSFELHVDRPERSPSPV